MATELNKDVKPGSESSAEIKPDVKATTFDEHANAMVESLISGASTEEEPSDVLKKNTTGEEEKTESVEAQEETVDKKNEQEPEQKEQKDEEATEEPVEPADPKVSGEEPKTVDPEPVPYVRFKEVNEKATRYEEAAKAHESVIGFCQQNNISGDQFREGLETLKAINSDPAEALKRLEPIVQNLRIATGNGLPADLQKDVDDAKKEFSEGLLSEPRLKAIEARAKEIAQSRFKHSQLEGKNRFDAMQQQQNEQQILLGAMKVWSESKRKLNPDFKPTSDPTKPGLFEDFLKENIYQWTLGAPKDVNAAVALADKAYDEVMKLSQRYAPKPKVMKAPPRNGHVRSTNTAPKSMDDVAKQIGAKHGFAM